MTKGCEQEGVTMWVLTNRCGHIGVSMPLTGFDQVSKSAVPGLSVLADIREVLMGGKLSRE